MPYSRRKSKSSSKSVLVVGILIIAGIVFLLKNNATDASTNLNPQDVPQTVSTSSDYWGGTDFGYRQKLNVEASDSGIIAAYTFDHANLVKNHQSQADGSDLKVVAQVDSATEVIPVQLSGANTASAQIEFDTSKYPKATYYLYFGNKQPDASKVLGTTTLAGKQPVAITAAAVNTPIVDLQTTNYWQLNYKDGVKLKASLKLQAPVDPAKASFYYVLDGSDNYQPLPKQTGDNNDIELDLKNIINGQHNLYVVATQTGQIYRSPTVKFRVSKPMLVAWTVDWEGYDVKDSVLEAFTTISAKYHVPITHFFNPRIYIDPTIPTYRRDQLTNWIKARNSQNGDEIAMHMHMQYDMVRAAGLTPMISPHWGTGADGYDVLTSDYNFDQMTQLLSWALKTFSDHGLPVPKGYRAGGWFASLDTLKAEQALGFVYDSSGRESYTFGSKNVKGPWSLPHTTQPYQPSTSNQNSADPAPNLDLWEMPNNGNDSYWFSAQDLIDRFYMNYTNPGKELDSTKLVTYLSHPDWFFTPGEHEDDPKIEALFTEISKYSYADDKGPVVFTTLSDALTQWQN